MTLGAALLLVAAVGTAPDPRPRLVELALAGSIEQSLAEIEREFESDPVRADLYGLELLRGDLLERSGEPREAARAFARALGGSSPLVPWARYRLARAQERLGHPEVAAGLVASLLAEPPGGALERRAIDLLRRAIDAGGDCRLLGGLASDRFEARSRRIRDLVALRCRARAGPTADLAPLRAFLEQAHDDELAWDAVQPHLEHPAVVRDRSLALLVGLTAYHHRDFERALTLFGHFSDKVVRGPFDLLGNAAAYAEARSTFWLGHFDRAAELYRDIAQQTRVDETRADTLFQLGRSRELGGDPDGAHESFLQAHLVDPRGRWGGASLLSLLRLEYLRGDLSGARKRLTDLAANSSFASFTARGALFLAASELVRGRSDRVGAFLTLAERTRERSAEEIAFWRGRLAERQGDLERALDHYLEAGDRRPFHPFSTAALARIGTPALARTAAERRRSLAAQSDPVALRRAAALAVTDADRDQLRRLGLALLARSPSAVAWVEGRSLPVADWPLWASERLDRTEDQLVALGLVGEVPTHVVRLFSARDPRTGMTGAALLASRSATRVAISLADTAFSRRPREVPLDWVSPAWLRLLYPLPWADLIESQAGARGIEPALLAAIIREESRFDPEAVSPAAARGLTQLVLPTARRLSSAGDAAIEPGDLHDPLVSIPLGASYLAELHRRFRGEIVPIAAAYNAGEDQTALWLRACYSTEPVELLSKIMFSETRAYVTNVVESRNAYRMLTFTGR